MKKKAYWNYRLNQKEYWIELMSFTAIEIAIIYIMNITMFSGELPKEYILYTGANTATIILLWIMGLKHIPQLKIREDDTELIQQGKKAEGQWER